MDINISLTDKQAEYLKLFAKNQYEGAKDNVCTHKPIHAVQTQRTIVVDDEFDFDKIVYVVNGWDFMEFDNVKELVEEYYDGKDCPIDIVSYIEAYDNDEDFEDINGEHCIVTDEEDYLTAYGIPDDLWERRAIKHYYEDVAYFFILESAKKYIEYQGHNLNNPRTYTKSQGYSNCGEYEHFWDLLMAMGIKLNEQ